MHEGISDHNYAKDLLSHQLLQTAFTQNIDGVLFYGTEKKKVGKLSRITVRVQYVCI